MSTPSSTPSATPFGLGVPALALGIAPEAPTEGPISIEQYDLLHRLGQGGMGVVWLARDRVLERQVAIKVLRPDRAAVSAKRLLREARVAARLTHPNIVSIYHVLEHQGHVCIVMEFLGRSLMEELQSSGPLPWPKATQAIRDAAAGLAAAHAAGLVHRDIKPSNLLRDHQKGVKVADFGLANSWDEPGLTAEGAIMGTPGYMSPEQLRGDVADARSDVYGIGCTYYHLLTGRAPIRPGDLGQALSKRARTPSIDPRKYAPDLPDSVCHVIETACRDDPQLRYPSAVEMLAELETILAPPMPLRQPAERGAKLRIFISSPGDVAEERVAAGSLVRRLSDEYADRLWIEPVFREPRPEQGRDEPPNQVSRPGDCDIFVCILWSRLGSPRPADVVQNDSRPVSRTESEFEEAAGKGRPGRPDFLVYRKTAMPVIDLDNEQTLLRRLEQKKALDTFIQKWFFQGDDAELKGAFHTFTGTADFELALEQHLRKLIQRRLPPGDAGGPEAAGKPTWTAGSPFRGLDFFDFEHAPVFFGRTQAISDVLSSLRANAATGHAFVLVVGVSGGGKSSLVRAGVVPLLTQPGVIEGVGLWRRAILKPSDGGGDLLRSLASALLSPQALPELASDGTTPDQLVKLLQEAPAAAFTLIKGGLSQAASATAGRADAPGHAHARLVLVADQLEEMFTLQDVTPQDRQTFVAALSSLARSGRVFVIATLRGDFYHRCFELPELTALQETSGHYALPLPNPSEIGQMIRRPARAAGLSFEEDERSSLDDVLLDAANSSPESLPLLEFALEELYQRRTPTGLLTFEAYQQLGGVEGALIHRAEAAFASLPADVQSMLPHLMRGLVSLGEGGAIARQQALVKEVAPTPGARMFVETFIKARLFTGGHSESGEAVVRVTHEALLRHWPRITQWLEHDKELLIVRGRVGAAATLWEAEGRRSDLLLGEGRPLGEAAALAAALGDDLDGRTRAFVRASAARARRHRKFTHAGILTMSVLTAIAVAAAIYARFERGRADVAASVAETRGLRQHEAELTASAERKRLTDSYVREGWSRVEGGDPAVGLLYFSRAIETAAGNEAAEAAARIRFATTLATIPHLIDVPLAGARGGGMNSKRALRIDGKSVNVVDRATNATSIVLDHGSTVNHAIFSPDGQRIITTGNEPGATIWEAASGQQLVRLEQGSRVSFAAFSPDGRFVVTVGRNMGAQVWESASGKKVGPPLLHGDAVLYAAFSPDGRRIVTCSQDKTAQIRTTASGEQIAMLWHTAAVLTACFSPDGQRVATGSKDKTAMIWDSATGERLVTCPHDAGVNGIAFSSDGQRLTTASDDRTSRVWDAQTGQAITPALRFPMRYVNAVGAFELWKEKRWTGAPTFDPASRVLDLPVSLISHDGNIICLAFSPEGRRVATGSDDRTARIWSAEDSHPLTPPLKHGGIIRTVAFSPDGRSVLTSSDDGTARLWNAATGEPETAPLAHKDILYAASFSTDGHRVVTASKDRTARVWDAASGRQIALLQHETGVRCAAFSPDGSRIATGCDDGAVAIWNAAGGKLLAPSLHKDRIFSIAFSPDGSRVVTSSRDHTAREWSAADGTELTKTPMTHEDYVIGASFSSDGLKILTGSYDKTARVWDVSTGEATTPPMRHAEAIRAASFSPDGMRLVTASDDRSARVWDRSTGLALTPPLRHADQVWAAAFGPDGRRVVTSGRDAVARIWDIVPDPRPASDLQALAELLSGQRVNSADQLDYLSDDEWESDWDRVRHHCPGQFGSFPEATHPASQPATAPADGKRVAQ